MQGYDPNRHRASDVGGCRESLLVIRIAFEILLPPIGAIIAVLALMVGTVLLLTSDYPALAILTVLPIIGGFVWLARRDKRIQAEMEEEARGRPGGPEPSVAGDRSPPRRTLDR
ncbi:MAG: hypothetical protein QF664_12200 [Dehalococcoidia bacterium]|jgi:hypothetical protein|nr:hypothetical protein [Dehalococcoidia bacterium]